MELEMREYMGIEPNRLIDICYFDKGQKKTGIKGDLDVLNLSDQVAFETKKENSDRSRFKREHEKCNSLNSGNRISR